VAAAFAAVVHDAAGDVVKVTSSRHDTRHGCWTYHAGHPAHLAGQVEVVWHSEGTASEPRDRHVPSNTVELLVNLGDPFQLVEPTGAAIFTETWLAGVQWGPVVTEQPRRHAVLGVRLRPPAAHALLRRPMSEVSGVVADLEDLVGRSAHALAERCGNAPSVEARLAVAAAWVTERLANGPAVHPAVAWAAEAIERSGGAVSIAALRAETGFSKTRLATAFREQIGVTPKRYARIVRFQRTLGMLATDAAPLADVAASAGYYDQAHMTAELRDMSGFTPGELLSVLYPAPNGPGVGGEPTKRASERAVASPELLIPA
jgi:AraC-like DNA-binding protein